MNARHLTAAERQRHREILAAACRGAEQGRASDQPSLPQLRVLDMIRTLTEALGIPPSQGQIAQALRLSTGTVAAFVVRLEALEYLRREGRSRELALTGKPFGAPCEHCAGSGRRS